MLEINTNINIDNINFLKFMENQQNDEDEKKQNDVRKLSSPQQEEKIK